MEINVGICPACGETHDGIEVVPYQKQQGPWTHHFTCRTYGDPVPLSIAMHAGAPMEVNTKIVGDIAKAQANGTAMLVAIFHVGNGRLHLDRHSVAFPHARFEECVRLLKENLEKESGPPVPTAPLPRAKPKQRIPLFGGMRPPISGELADKVGDAMTSALVGVGAPELVPVEAAVAVVEPDDDESDQATG